MAFQRPHSKIFHDYAGLPIRLTSERLGHILENPEMKDLAGEIGVVLRAPEIVVQSLSDRKARLYHRFYVGTRVGDKFLCVVVKVLPEEAFVLTAYLTDRVKRGEIPWKAKA